MTLKDIAARAAILDTLHKAIGDELKAAKRDLENGLRTAKKETGTQKVTISLTEQQDIGTATLVGLRLSSFHPGGGTLQWLIPATLL